MRFADNVVIDAHADVQDVRAGVSVDVRTATEERATADARDVAWAELKLALKKLTDAGFKSADTMEMIHGMTKLIVAHKK